MPEPAVGILEAGHLGLAAAPAQHAAVGKLTAAAGIERRLRQRDLARAARRRRRSRTTNVSGFSWQKRCMPRTLGLRRLIRYWRKLLGCRGAGELQRRDAVAALEMLVERALVVEADGRRHFGRCRRAPQTAGRPCRAGSASDRRAASARRALEQADELEGREPDAGRQVLQVQVGGVFGTHALRHPRQQHPVARRRRDAAAAAAVALEQPAEARRPAARAPGRRRAPPRCA